MRKGPYVFFNQMTGDRFRDLKAGFKPACKQRGSKESRGTRSAIPLRRGSSPKAPISLL